MKLFFWDLHLFWCLFCALTFLVSFLFFLFEFILSIVLSFMISAGLHHTVVLLEKAKSW
jgi:predicted PurR-regulated permease PerM